MISDGVVPKNIDQGYILRRLIRRAIREAYKMGYEKPFAVNIATLYIEQFSDIYDSIKNNAEKIKNELEMEEGKFAKTLKDGVREFEKMIKPIINTITPVLQSIQPSINEAHNKVNQIAKDIAPTLEKVQQFTNSDSFKNAISTAVQANKKATEDINKALS